MNWGSKQLYIFSLGGFCLGFFISYFLFGTSVFHQTSEDGYAVRQGGYQFINPLLSCNISENKQFSAYKPIENKFKTYVDQHISNGDATDISIYFRGLNSGRWSGVNENDTYAPASLMKVPLLIAYLKEADAHSNMLTKEIVYHQSVDANMSETFKPSQALVDGEAYSVADLLKYMIAYSDNNAANLLEKNIPQSLLIDVYSDLGIPVTTNNSADTITPKVYAYIFRILYNATYLSKPMSQYALELLTSVDFQNGIKAGVPQGVQSAQKFGERSVYVQNQDTKRLALSFRELHDCGIVYYPNSPYLLCVMTKGSDFKKLSAIIGDVSNIVYTETKGGVLKP